ncbi:MAG: NAD(P)/FAD-dependent oxidoreductase, partial [Candidatus Zixiibacteriota bacterium]
MPKKQVIVVGAGPAGLIAAGVAAKNGARTMLLEKMQRPGIKLRLTGAGRCNLTNSALLPDFIAHFGPGGRFLRQAFSQFFSSDLVEFLKKLRIRIVTESEGRVFPASGKAG